MNEESRQFSDRAVSIAFAVGLAFFFFGIGCVFIAAAYRMATAPAYADLHSGREIEK